MSVNPYAPPKAALTGTDNTTYLEEDGYAFHNELIANQHFKSPLICAKLGIPIPPEINPQPKHIKVTKVPRIPKLALNIASLLSCVLLFLSFFFIDPNLIFAFIFLYLIVAAILKFILTKPYKIPFYFSEEYTRIRSNRILTFTFTFIILAIITTYRIIAHHPETLIFSILGSLLTLIIYKFKTTYFVVTQTKGEFYYIRGVHQGLLDAIPHLPLSS